MTHQADVFRPDARATPLTGAGSDLGEAIALPSLLPGPRC